MRLGSFTVSIIPVNYKPLWLETYKFSHISYR